MAPDGPDRPDDEPDAGTNVAMPRATDAPAAVPPASSGSIDVQFSSPALPKAAPARPRRRRATTVAEKLTESITHIPVVKEVMPKSRRGRVLLRSVVVAFLLIATWITVIVYAQLRGAEKPDFRPQVEAVFVALRDGKAADVYARASNRFQEVVVEDAFETQVATINEVLGKFRELASIVDTKLYHGPSGQTALVQLLLEYERGRTRGSMSFHLEDGQWRMIGFHVDIPDEIARVEAAPEKREQRVKDPAITAEVTALATSILQASSEGRAGAVWDDAAQLFKDSIAREDFIAIEQERQATLGPFSRILQVTSSRSNPSKTGAVLDCLLEFRHPQMGSVTVTGTFKFAKIEGAWKLTFYKLIMPMPRGTTVGSGSGSAAGSGTAAPPPP